MIARSGDTPDLAAATVRPGDDGFRMNPFGG